MRTWPVAWIMLALAAGCPPRAAAAADVPAPVTQAFEAVYGQARPVSRVVRRPSEPACCREVTLTVTPGALVEIGDHRLALVSLESNPLGSHAEAGAISVAYLSHRADVWRVERVWHELAWTGDSGQPADRLKKLTPPGVEPLVFAIRTGVWQGEEVTTAWTVILGRDAPRLAGEFHAGDALEADNGCSLSKCGAWAYTARIERPSAAGALFSVAYTGWRESPGVHRPIPFDVVANFTEHGGTLLATPPVHLPGS